METGSGQRNLYPETDFKSNWAPTVCVIRSRCYCPHQLCRAEQRQKSEFGFKRGGGEGNTTSGLVMRLWFPCHSWWCWVSRQLCQSFASLLESGWSDLCCRKSCSSITVLATLRRMLGILSPGCWLCLCLGLSFFCVLVLSSCFLPQSPVSTDTSLFSIPPYLGWNHSFIKIDSYIRLTSLSPSWILRFLLTPECGWGFL